MKRAFGVPSISTIYSASRSSSADGIQMTCSCIYFLEPYTIFFSMCFVLLTINLCCFFLFVFFINIH